MQPTPLPPIPELDRGPDWRAVIKPAGISSVPDPHRPGTSVLERLRAGGADLRTVGRLDRAAGGILLLAEGPEAQRRLGEAWRAPDAVKRYLARTLAPPMPAEGLADEPVGRGRKGAMRVGRGRPARTRYRMLETREDGTTLVVADLETGRRHQIRLHLAAAGAPLVGDTLYARAAERVGGFHGDEPAPRPTPPDCIDLWCVRLSLPAAGIDLTSAAPFAPDRQP